MKKILIIALLLGLCSWFYFNRQDMEHTSFTYPVTEKVDSSDVYFGTTVADPYRWLEDDYSEKVVQWVKEQNTFATEYLNGLPEKKAIKNRLAELWNYERYSTPFRHHKTTFFFKNNGTQNQSVLYRVADDGTEEVILDPNTFSADGTSSLSGFSFSKSGKYLAYGISAAGSDWKTVHVKDMETGEILSDTVSWVKFSGISWQGNGFYYSRYAPPKSGDEFSQKNEFHQVYYHQIGTLQHTDKLIFEDQEHGQRNFYAGTSEDERFVFISGSESTSGNALWVVDENKKTIPLVAAFDKDFNVVDTDGRWVYVLTNFNAPNNQLIKINLDAPQQEHWVSLIPEKDEVLQSVVRSGDRFVVKYLRDVTSELFVVDRQSGAVITPIALPEVGTVGGISGGKEYSDIYFSFSNYIRPTTIYSYDLPQNKLEVFRKTALDFDSDQYETKRVFYTSKDGTKIPLFINYKKGMERNGTNPTFLYGYGGFDISITPGFSVARAVLMEQGAIFAVANLRGGGEYGEAWHQQGTQMQKQNVFDDFIAAAEYLIEEQYTQPEKLAIHGRSNGGLLIGAALTQRPDLFGVAIPTVGVLDMLRYHQFTIGWAWAGDYGRSDDSKEMFDYLFNYSPVHNVETVKYPATMVVTGDHDDRVVPAHSFKFAAELQAKNQSEHPMVLRVDINAGHGAGKPIDKQIDEWADIYAFMFHHLN